MVRPYRSLRGEIPRCLGAEKNEFESFMRDILHWQPERRATARRLLRHTWLDPRGFENAGWRIRPLPRG